MRPTAGSAAKRSKARVRQLGGRADRGDLAVVLDRTEALDERVGGDELEPAGRERLVVDVGEGVGLECERAVEALREVGDEARAS